MNARNSGRTEYYSVNDVSPDNNKCYYRLMSVDKDGVVSYSKIISISKKDDLKKLSLVYDANGNRIVIVSPLLFTRQYRYLISTVEGRIIQQGQVNIGAGNSSISLNKLAPRGVYSVYFYNGVIKEQIKIAML